MRPPSQSDNFNIVASKLVEEDDEDLEWRRCANARSRAAISRAYYAVFLALKYRLLPLRHNWPKDFPTVNVHTKLARALAGAGVARPIARTLGELRTRREHADYEWNTAVDEDTADSMVQKAGRALEEIATLSRKDAEAIALELHKVEVDWQREEEERRRRR